MNQMDPVKEVCVESFDEAIRAIESGASRIELCENLAAPQLTIIVAGKVTFENFEEIRKKVPSGEYHGRRLVAF